MNQNETPEVPPWLQGLDEAWEEVPDPTVNKPSVRLDSSIARSTLGRIPRKSLSTLHSSIASRRAGTQPSTQKRRSPLATLSNNEFNSLRRNRSNSHSSGARSVSEASEGSVVRYNTIQQRAKSDSPSKEDGLEWKKRLLQGQVAYGDQTELFGPSGLDNIFANPQSTGKPAENKKAHVSWVDRSGVAAIPSSPPPWPITDRTPLSCAADPESSNDADDGGSLLFTPHGTTHAHGSFTGSDDPASDASDDRQRTQDDVGANRTIGGQTELEQEDFSPVFISKHTTVNGQIGYKALDSHFAKQLPRNDSKTVQFESDDHNAVDSSAFTDGPESQASVVAPDFSLSENLPTGTPPGLPLGSKVEVNRGGYLRVGSFRHRKLSSSQVDVDRSTVEPAPELLSPLSTSALRLPEAPSPPRLPKTPLQESLEVQPKSRSSGSPLKLFGPHDTFTNNRLLRRMSQLDPDLSTVDAQEDSGTTKEAKTTLPSRQPSSASFGNGELDQHAFDAEITISGSSEPASDGSDRSPGSEIAPPGSRIPLDFRIEVSPAVTDTFKLKRSASKRSAVHRNVSFGPLAVDTDLPPGRSSMASSKDTADNHATAAGFGSGKRPPTTPGKDSTPKRRRTLHFSEIAHDDDGELSTVQQEQMQSTVSSRKRKDARKGDDMLVAQPDILSQRKILRPRNPSPTQRVKERIEAEIRETAEEFISQEPERLEAVMEQIESSMAAESPPSMKQQAQMVANEVAKFSLRVQRASGDQTERKRSVTTQDFFDEAVMVMKLIRERAGRQSVLGSVAESDQEALSRSQGSAVFDEDPSSLRVSRPPSREGGSGWRPRSAQTTDVRILSHLRRFQEKDDTDFIAESMAALEVQDREDSPVVAMDEEANIRISGPSRAASRPDSRGGNGSAPNSYHSNKSEFQTQATQNSAGTSTARTLHTSSTRKSENVGTLGPDAVAHLIGDHVGGMIFDKEKRQWVRIKGTSERRMYGSFLEPLSTITSDDDPFREISDLPVDEAKEEEIRRTSCSRVTPRAQSDHVGEMPPQRLANQSLDFTTADIDDPTSDPSNLTLPRDPALESSQQQQVETRATSWSDEDLRKLAEMSMVKTSRLMFASTVNPALHSTQPVITPSEPAGPSPDIILSSELPNDSFETQDETENDELEQVDGSVLDVSVVDASGSNPGLREDTTVHHNERSFQSLQSPKLRRLPQSPIQIPSSVTRTANRQISLRRKTLTGRLNTDAMEQSELSFVAAFPGERKMTVSLSVSRPVSSPPRSGQIIASLSSPSKFEPSFVLSDLPDFTISEEDPERPSERLLAERLAQHAVAEVNDRFAYAVKDLVKTLADVKEGEPCWGDVKQLDLRSRSLSSVHGLEDFCARIQDVNLSGNAISHLNGAPASIRHLAARSNSLSSLTSWTHLMNLQYLDISGNHLENLDGLSCLIHLREIRADDNKLRSIDGIQHLDGLLKFRARRNQILAVDFEHSTLQRLGELDLCSNQIKRIDGLEYLTALDTVRLDCNPIEPSTFAGLKLPLLRTLSLQECGLRTLDVSDLSSLRNIHIDGNSLTTVHGIAHASSLELLSMRRQHLPDHTPITILAEHLEARTLRLSGNTLPTLSLPHSLLSLQRLDLASCGLTALPDDFGLRCPNLRSLNLNFNALRDVRPLLNIADGLTDLGLAGNLLTRLRATTATLARLRGLSSLDLRDNPLTLGLHAPRPSSVVGVSPASTVIVHRTSETGKAGNCGIEDEDAIREEAEAGKYRLPDADVGAQDRHVGMLEEGVGLRRRVYLMLLANGCGNLEKLDGADFDRDDVMVRDRVWDRLVELGIVKKSTRAGKHGSQEGTGVEV